MFEFERSEENPILVPNSKIFWESDAVFNGCPVVDKNKIHFLYRAMSATKSSSIGYATSKDGVHFKNRRQFIRPDYEWEKFGCEDPRVTKLDGKYYVFYTALSTHPFSAEGIKVAVAITKNFKKIEKKHLVTPFNAKAMALFPEKINGKMVAILTVDTDKLPSKICLAFFDKEEQIWSKEFWKKWYASIDSHTINLHRSPHDHVEVGAPPIKTKKGWLLFYSHIQNYFSPPATFGIEAALLDLKNPSKILSHTNDPLLVPQEEYEKYGIVPNIAFPSGVFVKRGKVFMYYGAADTVCSLATGQLDDILELLHREKIHMQGLDRFSGNPIIEPNPENAWESKSTFNPGAIYANKKIHIIYRAMSKDNTSVFGYASSVDGLNVTKRLEKPIYIPREDFESKKVPNGNSGCEDPRLTKIGDTIYMLYTAYNGKDHARVALTSISFDNFTKRNWNWKKPILISPPNMDDKDAAIFPKKINGKYAVLHRLGVSIWIDFVDDLNFKKDKWLGGKILMSSRSGPRDSQKIGIAGPPIETEIGWLLIYHGISKRADHHYHLRAALLDLDDPTKVIVRTKYPILDPKTDYEKNGDVPNVVFSNGAVVKNGKLFVYYGGADKVIGVATTKMSTLLKRIVSEKGYA